MRPLLAFTLAALAMAILAAWPHERPTFSAGQMKGAWLAPVGAATLDSPQGLAALRHLRELGCDTVAIGPEIVMPDINAPQMHIDGDEAKLRAFLRSARAAGLRVFLLPRIESPAFFQPPFPWRADIAMKSEEDWSRFFERFTEVLVQFATLAREEGVAVLGLGLEYRTAVKRDPDKWREVARKARAAFGGPVTYSANWDDFDQITWWDAVDYIGIGAYFELLDDGLPKDSFDPKRELPPATLGTLLEGWEPIRQRLRELSMQYGRPVFFTEVGYAPFADCGYYPWRWQPVLDAPAAADFGPPVPGATASAPAAPAPPPKQARPLNARQQALCYRALIRAFAGEDWWRGLCMWRFYTDAASVPEWDYSPQGREAEAVLRDAYAPVR